MTNVLRIKIVKIFERDYKINFVDTNNVFVGFDYSPSCCEYFGYAILAQAASSLSEISSFTEEEEEEVLDSYTFDTSFESVVVNENPYSEDNTVVFKLVSTGKKDLFLHLYNSHNGYYSHGFDMTENGKVLFSGAL